MHAIDEVLLLIFCASIIQTSSELSFTSNSGRFTRDTAAGPLHPSGDATARPGIRSAGVRSIVDPSPYYSLLQDMVLGGSVSIPPVTRVYLVINQRMSKSTIPDFQPIRVTFSFR